MLISVEKMSTKSVFLALSIITIIVFASMISLSNQMARETKKVELFFSYPFFQSDGEYIRVDILEATSQLVTPGNPLIPYSSLDLSFPLGTKILNIDVSYNQGAELAVDKKIHPAPQQIPLNCQLSPATFFENSDIYNSDMMYPNQTYTYRIATGLNNEKHVTILTVQIYPLRYFPLSDKIRYSQQVTLDIEYEIPSKSFFSPQQTYELIILSPNEFHDALQPLVDHKEIMNISSCIINIEDIPQVGKDQQEDIKYFIKEAVENWGTHYVLLVGGMNYFPVRETHVKLPEDNEVFISDLYYADIYNAAGTFSDWDSNNNGVYGEYNWDGNTDEIDLCPDVYLGRLPCTSIEEVVTAVNKIIRYESTRAYAQDWFTNIIVCGGDTAPGDSNNIDEGEYINQKVLEIMDVYNSITLWASKDELSSASNINNAIEQGAGFLSFSGHGSPTSWATHPHEKDNIWLPTGGYRTGTISGLSNGDRLPVVITSACSTSKFNRADNCFGWSFIVNPQGGAIATLGSTGLGYIYIGKSVSSGLMGKMEIECFEAYQEQDVETFGELWAVAINNYIIDRGRLSDSDYKTIEEWQAFGDPSLIISSLSNPPDKPLLEGPSSGKKGNEYFYRARTADPEANQVFYWFDWGDGTGNEWIGPFPSNVTIESSHVWDTQGDYVVKVKTKDEYGRLSEWSDPVGIKVSLKFSGNLYLKQGFLHLFGRPLLKTIRHKTLVIGKVYIGLNTENPIDQVVFSMDSQICYTDLQLPYEFLVDNITHGRHTITISSYYRGLKRDEEIIPFWILNI